MNNVLMTSSNGNFCLCHRHGVGINDTPYEELRVTSVRLADKYVIEIRLDADFNDFNGKHIKNTYNDVYIAHGMRSAKESLAETKEYVEVLNEAIEFAEKIKDYIEYNDEWKSKR